MRGFAKLISNKKFLYLWISQILSQLTVNIMTFLIIVRLFEKTGSTIVASFVWIAYSLPALLIGPFAAASIDIFDKRKVLMIANLLQSLTIFLYSLLYKRYFYFSYGVVLIYSMLNQFYLPAETSSIPAVVKRKQLPRANGLFFITEQASLIAGFGLAGLVNGLLGFRAAFTSASGLLLIAFISVSFLPKLQAGKLAARKFEQEVVEFFKRILEGYTFIKGNRSIFIPFVLLIALQMSLAITIVNLPVLASNVVKTRPGLAGILMVLPGGLGALIATATVPYLIDKGWRKKKLIEIGLGGLALSAWSLSLIVPVLNFWLGRLLAIAIFILAGFSFVSVTIPSLTHLQEKTPGDLMGRVFGNFWFITTAITVLPVLFSATITEIFGVRLLFVILGMIVFIGMLSSRYIGSRIIVKKR